MASPRCVSRWEGRKCIIDKDDNDDDDDDEKERENRPPSLESRPEERGQTRRGEGGVLPSSWQTLVRGGGRLGWLEGVPFQTLRIDLFVDGTPSLHPLLVVVDHILKLFQRSLSFLSAIPF